MKNVKNIKPRIKEPNLFGRLCVLPSIIKKRFRNINTIYPQHFQNDPFRFQEYLTAKKIIMRHPWWLISWKPTIPKNTSANKMAYSMICGPVWQWESQELRDYISSHKTQVKKEKWNKQEIYEYMKKIDKLKQTTKVTFAK